MSVHSWVSGCTDGCVVECTYVCVVGCTDGCVVGCIDGCLVGCTDGCTDWVEGFWREIGIELRFKTQVGGLVLICAYACYDHGNCQSVSHRGLALGLGLRLGSVTVA